MTTITIGSHVTFTQRTTYRPYLHSVTGVVVDLLPWSPCALALVELDSGLMDKLVPVSALSVVEDEYIQAGDRVHWVRDQAWCSGCVISVRDWRDGIYVQRVVEAGQDDVAEIGQRT